MKNLNTRVQQFDKLPNSARIRGYEFRQLLGIGNSTFYRRIASGEIPKPAKDKTWSASKVRDVLSAGQDCD